MAMVTLGCAPDGNNPATPTFAIELSQTAADEIASLGREVPVTGRAYVIITRDGEREPRLQTGLRGVPFWGMEVRDLEAGGEAVLSFDGESAIGYPLGSFQELPPGEYTAQAFLNVFTTFHRSDGHSVEMHLNSRAGQSPWRAADGGSPDGSLGSASLRQF